MKKKIVLLATFVLAAALGLCALAGCGGGSSASSSAATSTASDGSAQIDTLVVGFDAEYPPYGFMADDGSYTGFDLDLAQAVADMNGWNFEAKPIDWDSKDVELDSGNINCIWNGFTIEGREGQYAFTDPYMINEQVVVVSADSDIADLSDLDGAKVVTQAGSAALDVLSEEGDRADLAATFDGGAPQTIADYNNAFLQLDSGAVDAVACDLSIAQYQLSQSPDKYVQLDEALSSEHYGVGFKLGDDATADAVSESLKALYADGSVEALCEKYASYGLTFDNWVLK